ncbi:hypothetical protein D1007_04169 [Hordeum vulgare]|nr:hypothetical protein D1007_04169 [Hordeum vulgare]
MLPSMMRDKYEALKNYGLEESEATIFQSGAKLGRQLGEIEDATRRWKVLADFWCEMMLYVAPSDNVNEHFEQLVQGGEFITHLWALLSHAGILERGQDQQTTPGLHPRAENTCEGRQEIEQDSASHEGTTRHLKTTSLAHHLAATSPAHHLAGNLQTSDFAMHAPSPQTNIEACVGQRQTVHHTCRRPGSFDSADEHCRMKSTGRVPSECQNRPPVFTSSSPQGSSSNSSDFRRQERHGDPSNTPDETDYQNPTANPTPLEGAIVATQEAAQNIHIAGRAPADRNVASV